MMPELPVEIWAHIFDMIEQERSRVAAMVIQDQFRAYAAARMMRLGPLSYLLRYIRKVGPNEVSAVAGAARLCSVVEWQSRGHPHVHFLI